MLQNAHPGEDRAATPDNGRAASPVSEAFAEEPAAAADLASLSQSPLTVPAASSSGSPRTDPLLPSSQTDTP